MKNNTFSFNPSSLLMAILMILCMNGFSQNGGLNPQIGAFNANVENVTDCVEYEAVQMPDGAQITFTLYKTNECGDPSHFVIPLPPCVDEDDIIVSGDEDGYDFENGPCDLLSEEDAVLKVDINQTEENEEGPYVITIKLLGTSLTDDGKIGVKGGQTCSENDRDVPGFGCTPPPVGDPCEDYGDIAEDLYQVKDHTREAEAYKHSVWVNGFPCQGAKSNFSFNDTYKGYAYTLLSNGNFIITGTAVLSGIQSNNCDVDYEGSLWNVYFEFAPIEDVSGVDPFSAHGFDDTGFPEDPIWDYYELIPGRGEMTLLEGDFEYDAITFTKMDNDYAFQVGDGANAKNSGLGAASWLNYTVWSDGQEAYSNSGAIHADININLHELECEEPPCEGPDCEEPRDPCENYSAFYVDNARGSNQGVLHGVNFTGGEAVFTELKELGYKAHLSYDPTAQKIYVNKNNGDFIEIFNTAGDSQGTIDISDANLSGVCTNAFSRGYVYLGSGSQNKIIKVDPLSGNWELFAWNLPISGGDIAFRDGVLYLATRSGKKLYTVGPGDDNTTLIGQTVKKVNGMALGPDNDNFVMTNSGKEEVFVINPSDGSTVDSYDAVKNNEPFELYNGDLASGCSDGGGEEPNDCESYVAYYTDHDGDNKSKIFGVSFNGGDAVFTEITTRDYEVHLTYNSDDGYIYTIDADNATYLERIDPVFGTGQIINLSAAGDEGPLNKVTAITYQGGQVYIGSDANDKVYVASFVDAMNAEYEFVADAPVSGGDLAFKDGRLFLATRSGNRLIRIDAGNTTTDVGSVPNKVTGLAVSEDNNFLTTNNNKNVVYELADDGTPIGNGYNVTGDLSVLKNGDFSSGCGDNGAGDPFCFVSEVVNPGAEINDIADNDGWEQYGPGELTAVGGGWDTTSSIEIQRSGSVNGVESHCDSGFHFELLSRAPQDNMYQVFSTDPGSLVHVVFYHKKRPGGSSEDTMQVEYGSDLNSLQLLGTHSVSADDGWARVEMSFTATSAQTVVLLRGVSGSTGSVGNLIDDVYVGCDADMAVEPCDSQGPPALVPHTGAYSDLIIAEDDITLYPVPAVSSLNIQVDNEGAPVEGTYYITSITGRVSHQGTIQINNGVQSSTVHESVESLPEGMYFLVMEVNGNRITKQFVKTNR